MNAVIRPAIERLLEDVGIVIETSNSSAFLHRLLKPIDLVVTPGVGLTWDALEYEEVDFTLSRQCLWDFIATADASPDVLLPFVRKWGVFYDALSYSERELREPSDLDFDVWQSRAESARAIVMILVATEADELVSDNLLFPLYSYGMAFEEPKDSRREPDAYRESLTNYERAKREKGIALQMELAVREFNLELTPHTPRLTWDDRGRAVGSLANGVVEIAWSHIRSLYAAPTVDVFRCSMCSTFYEFDEATGLRRPKKGMGRYCSEACRLEARRRSNRASWDRNKTRWRASHGK